MGSGRGAGVTAAVEAGPGGSRLRSAAATGPPRSCCDREGRGGREGLAGRSGRGGRWDRSLRGFRRSCSLMTASFYLSYPLLERAN